MTTIYKIVLPLLILLLTACGGGGSDSSNDNNSDSENNNSGQTNPTSNDNLFFLPNRIAIDRNLDGIEDAIVTREWITDSENFYVGREEKDFNADGFIDYIKTEEVTTLADIRRIDDNGDGTWDEVTTLEYNTTITDRIPSREVTVNSSGVILEEVNYSYSDYRLIETRLISTGGSSDIDREITQFNDEGKIVLELIDFSNDGVIDSETVIDYVISGDIETITTTSYDFDPVLGRWISSITTQTNDFNTIYNTIDIMFTRYEINATGTGVVLIQTTFTNYSFDQFGNITELSSDMDGDGLFENITVVDNQLNSDNLSSLARYDENADSSFENSISRTYQEVDLTGLIEGSDFAIRPQDLIIAENIDPTIFLP